MYWPTVPCPLSPSFTSLDELTRALARHWRFRLAMHLYTYLYLLVPLVTFHLILGTGTLDDGGALTERRSADATALKAEPVLLQKSAARSTDDNGKDRLTQMKRILKQRGNKARGEEELQENQELIREKSNGKR